MNTNSIINESELRRLIEIEVRKAINTMLPLNEIAMPRAEYKKKIESLFPQLLENLVVIIYAINVKGRFERWIGHWSIELKGHMKTLARYTIKKNNSYEMRLNAIKDVIQENDWLNSETAILLTVHNKLTIEGMTDDKINVNEAIHECHETIMAMVETILTGSVDEIDSFVDNVVNQ